MTPASAAAIPRLAEGTLPPGPDRAGLWLPRRLLDGLARAARSGYPREVCALLVGRWGPPPGVRRVLPAANLAAEPRTAFEVDPGAIVRAERTAAAGGDAVLGFWHSHPDGEARPSRADASGAWGGFFHLVTAVTEVGACATRGWLAVGAGLALGSGLVEVRLLPGDPPTNVA